MTFVNCCVVGLSGDVGHGKDTFADMLVDELNYTKFSFAEPMRQSLVALLGIPMEYFTDRVLKEVVLPQWGKSPREFMQLFGTEFLRTFIAEDFLIRRMEEEITKLQKAQVDNTKVLNIVITDCRFANEVKWVKESFSQTCLFRIEAYERVLPVLKGNTAVHASENGGIARELYDAIINNNGTKADLATQIHFPIHFFSF